MRLALLLILFAAPVAAQNCDRPPACAKGEIWNPELGKCEQVSS